MADLPTADQMAAVGAVLDRLAEGRAQRPSLSGLIEGWRALVEEIEAGFGRGAYHYFDALRVRAALEVVLAEAPWVADWVREQVVPFDARFRAATVEAGSGALLERVPRHPGVNLARELADPEAATVLYRPVGDEELALIEASGFTRFPPRLDEQPIFYPVLSQAYAERIAREWNVPAGGAGHVTRFAVRTAFLVRYPSQAVGGDRLRELWVPAEELDEFCDHIVGTIEVVTTFRTTS